jgi:hypothetical protein
MPRGGDVDRVENPKIVKKTCQGTIFSILPPAAAIGILPRLDGAAYDHNVAWGCDQEKFFFIAGG